MFRTFLATSALLACSGIAIAQDVSVPMTVEQCRSILIGLNALNCAGEQVGGHCAPDAKQYKLGAARITIAVDVAALTTVISPIETGQAAFLRELPPLPTANDKDRPGVEAENNKKSVANWAEAMKRPCNIKLGHLSAKDLKIGDGADENAIPPEVLSIISPIIDGFK